jgi:hypothetical protein
MTVKSVARSTVSQAALIKRINRKLAHLGEQLKTCRGERWLHELGTYYTIDTNRNSITGKHIDLEQYGRELGVLAPCESVDDDE